MDERYNRRFRMHIVCLNCNTDYVTNAVDHLDSICRCKVCRSTKVAIRRKWGVR